MKDPVFQDALYERGKVFGEHVFLVRRPCYRLFFAQLIELASLLLEAPALPALLFGTLRRRRRPDDGAAGALLHVLGVEPVVGEQG